MSINRKTARSEYVFLRISLVRKGRTECFAAMSFKAFTMRRASSGFREPELSLRCYRCPFLASFSLPTQADLPFSKQSFQPSLSNIIRKRHRSATWPDPRVAVSFCARYGGDLRKWGRTGFD
jgi:hypothetical protein